MIQRNDFDGLLFFDKKSGLNFLIDEVKIEKPSLAPRHVSIALTTSCNLSCEHCYITHNNQQLDINQVKEWIDVLSTNECLSIGLGGGEPTLWYDLIELIDYINATQMAVTLTTNGSADISLYRSLAQKVNLLRFSIDGIGNVYESYRKQSYIDLKNKILELKKSTNYIGLNYLLTDKTVLQLDEFTELVYEVQAAEVLLIPCLTITGERLLSDQSMQITQKWIEKYQDEIPLAFSYSSMEMIESRALPIQSFDLKNQKHYFLHINANCEIMQSVFDSNSIKIYESLATALKKVYEGEHL